MNTTIDNICKELNTTAQSIKQYVVSQIEVILPKQDVVSIRVTQTRTQDVVSNPERPWIVVGGAALTVGVLGSLFSGSSWSYILGGAGLASILYGQTKKRPQKGLRDDRTSQDVSEPNGYEIAAKVIEISKDVEYKWRDKVEEAKSLVQRAIEESDASAELKDSLMGETYTTERISINFDDVISRLETQPSSAYPLLLSEYGRIMSNCIDNASDEQIAIYRSISQKL